MPRTGSTVILLSRNSFPACGSPLDQLPPRRCLHQRHTILLRILLNHSRSSHSPLFTHRMQQRQRTRFPERHSPRREHRRYEEHSGHDINQCRKNQPRKTDD
ncbi:hypothetical protein K491DRAFT_241595 [Lophiostoma macrostomum CBS 122681]|uniref:Uncharacterized protein n=1 Tax=Lophiostoma macrostomum CBS 122681 TaxID=1314788 RepID=A0A6A6SL24_9PLEO|nr:hypothetical protein K491DRAFT_241595 [Lophiostoma macrostomum CBS 122681]